MFGSREILNEANSFRHFEAPSKTLINFTMEIVDNCHLPILDAGCGFGRNAVALASRGMSVVCADIRGERLNALARFGPRYMADRAQGVRKLGKLYPILANLHPAAWPFRENCFGGIVCVHFVSINLFEAFQVSLIPGGYFYFETFGAHGGNYLDLPRAGQLRNLLEKDFKLKFYREKKVGPIGSDAVTVRLFAQKLVTGH
jgi:SAM-dependent methyltransferase